jgi:hypothetical protein
MSCAPKPAILLRGRGSHGPKNKALNDEQESWLITEYTKTPEPGERRQTVDQIIAAIDKRFKVLICRKTFYNVLRRHGAQEKGQESQQ